MSIWEKLGFGGYRGFSREAEQLLQQAVELAGSFGCSQADTGPKDKLPGQLAALPHGLSEGHSHGSQQQPRRAAIILQHGTKQVFRLRP